MNDIPMGVITLLYLIFPIKLISRLKFILRSFGMETLPYFCFANFWTSFKIRSSCRRLLCIPGLLRTCHVDHLAASDPPETVSSRPRRRWSSSRTSRSVASAPFASAPSRSACAASRCELKLKKRRDTDLFISAVALVGCTLIFHNAYRVIGS